MRRLVSTRRRVPAAEQGSYRTFWDALALRLGGAGARAWRFVSESDPELFVEFMEFASPTDPRDSPEVSDHLGRLERTWPGTAEAWEEARG